MSENQNALIYRHIPASYRRRDAQKRDFRHYMAQIGPNFPPESAHGSKFPWDVSADPWDGNRNPRDGSTRKSLPPAFPTLKGGATRVSALTECQIAHRASPAPRCPPRSDVTCLARTGCPPRRDAIHRVSHVPDGHRGGRMPWRGCAPSVFGRQEWRPSYTASPHGRPRRGRAISSRG